MSARNLRAIRYSEFNLFLFLSLCVCMGVCVCVCMHVQVAETLSALLPQLTHLHMRFFRSYPDDEADPPYYTLLSSPTPSHTLTHLVLQGQALTSEIVELLLEHAPALEHVTAGFLEVEEDHSGEEWGVSELRVERGGADAEYLVRLPKRRDGGKLAVYPQSVKIGVALDEVRTHTHTHTHTHIQTYCHTHRCWLEHIDGHPHTHTWKFYKRL